MNFINLILECNGTLKRRDCDDWVIWSECRRIDIIEEQWKKEEEEKRKGMDQKKMARSRNGRVKNSGRNALEKNGTKYIPMETNYEGTKEL